jgi:hypothetical protein
MVLVSAASSHNAVEIMLGFQMVSFQVNCCANTTFPGV